MYRFLLQGKWIALTLLLVLVVPLSVVAADWQYNRWQARKQQNSTIAANISQPPDDIDSLLPPDSDLRPSDEWRVVTVTGRYVDGGTRLLRRQVVNGRSGFIVLSPLLTGAQRVVVIERGFIPLPPSGQPAAAPTAPTGEVTVTGRLRTVAPSDAAVRPDDIPADQVNRIDIASLSGGRSGYRAVVEMTASDPADSPALTPLPYPQVDEGPHLSYVGQWGLIGLASIVIWVIIVRREAVHRREQAGLTG